jgi:hypothetical protein
MNGSKGPATKCTYVRCPQSLRTCLLSSRHSSQLTGSLLRERFHTFFHLKSEVNTERWIGRYIARAWIETLTYLRLNI